MTNPPPGLRAAVILGREPLQACFLGRYPTEKISARESAECLPASAPFRQLERDNLQWVLPYLQNLDTLGT